MTAPRLQSVVADVCSAILADYIEDPWMWPRESDLGAEVVGRLMLLLNDEKFVEAHPAHQRYHGQPKVRVPRVRTELKAKPDSSEKVDIGVLGGRVATVHLNRNGPRDVGLRVEQDELAAVIELKLEPGMTQVGWVDDVEKLLTYTDVGLRVALWIDTSLPLAAVGLSYGSAPNPGKALATYGVSWPLRRRSFTLRSLNFELEEVAPLSGTYLAALAVVDDTSDFSNLLPPGSVSTAWWRVVGTV